MKTLIIDDEKPAISILSSFVKKIPFLNLHTATTDAFAGLEILNSQKIDLLLLDIEMPDITGLELLNSLEQKPLVIFTTAYEDYALKGYELDIVDYLVKPIRFERFLKGINKANKLYQANSQQKAPISSIQIKVDYKNVKINCSDILYIEGLKDYIKIYTKAGMVLTRLNLKGIETQLPKDEFIRVHRSFIVSISKVSAFHKSQISINKVNIPLGNVYKEEVLRLLN